MSGSDVRPSWQLGAAAALERLRELERAVRVAEAELLDALLGGEVRGLAADFGYRDMRDLQQEELRVSRVEAKNRMVRARAMASPDFAATASAMRSGSVSARHLDKLVEFHASLSENADFSQWAETEGTIATYAQSCDPVKVKQVLERDVRLRIDPDGALPVEKELAEPRNRLSFRRKRNGWAEVRADIEPEMAALWEAQLKAFMYRHNDAHDPLDTRSPDEVRGDAQADLIKFGNSGRRLPEVGGERPQLVVSINWVDLVAGSGTATMGPDHQPIPVSEARRLACDSDVLPIVLGGEGKPLDIGASSRTIPAHIRRLVANRDRGCTFPGCVRPPTQSEIHHILEWRHGGTHKPENLAMLCPRHHRLVHHSDWQVRMAANHHPEFIPPSYQDPARSPRTNRAL